MTQHTIVIDNATIVDGTGRPRFRGSVGVRDGRIVSIEADGPGKPAASTGLNRNSDPNLQPHPQPDPNHRIDAEGRVLAPGFIDVHTHDDIALIQRPEMPEKLTQGVTTVMVGHCGFSPYPLSATSALPGEFAIVVPDDRFRFPDANAYFQAVAETGPAVNYLGLVGHSALRVATMQDLTRPADAREVSAMIGLLTAALEAGAIGLSSGLAYSMAKPAPTDELVMLCRAMAAQAAHDRGFYVTHLRDEGDFLLEAVDEALAIGRDGGVPVIFSHHKASGAPNHGKTALSLARIAAARQSQRIGMDAYPYTFSSTALTLDRVQRGGRVVIARSGPHPEMAGKTLDQVAVELDCDFEAAVERLQPAGALYFAMDEEDLRRVLAFDATMIGSDGLPFDPKPHPRLWGTFPRVLSRYVREDPLLTLEDAVHRMTGLAADTFHLDRRGRIEVGSHADLVLFDDRTIHDAATAEDPMAPSVGVTMVMVNGQIGLQDGMPTGARAGTHIL